MMIGGGRLLVLAVVVICLLFDIVSAHTAQRHQQNRPSPRHSPPSNTPSSPSTKPSRFHRIRKNPISPSSAPPSQAVASSSSTSSVSKRGLPGTPGDIEWMGFYGSLLAVPTMLSILGIQTNYNLEKSYFNSQLSAQYYKQSRELFRAHSAKLTREQEAKFAKAGYVWPGMIYDADGEVRKGARVPEWGGKVVGGDVKAEGKLATGNTDGAGGEGTHGARGAEHGSGTVSGEEGGAAAGSGSGDGAGGAARATSHLQDAKMVWPESRSGPKSAASIT